MQLEMQIELWVGAQGDKRLELPTCGIKGTKMSNASLVNGHLRDTAGARNC